MRERFIRILFTFAALCLSVVGALASEVSFTVDVPRQVAIGEGFPVKFSLNAKPEERSFEAPVFSGVNVIAGPSISSGSSVQVVNGAVSKSVNVTYTYILVADSAGRYDIPSAKVKVDNEVYESNSSVVEVVESTPSAASASSDAPSARVGKDDVLLRMLLSSNEVYKGEPIRAVFKLYTRVDIVNYDNFKAPLFNGFWAQEVTPQSGRAEMSRETYNGEVYDTYVIKEYLLYPQQSGQIEIEPMQMDAIAQVVVQSDNIDPFFGRSNEFYNVRRSVSTKARTVDVKRLPSGAPESFTGAVGSYDMELIPLESNAIEANSAKLMKVRIFGTGNISFVQAPKLELPNSFEQYVVRTTESIQTTSQGASGYKEFEYPIIARSEGDYTIPAVEFSYFDPSVGAYTTLHTNPFSVTILPDKRQGGAAQMMRGGVAKEDVALIGSDIRFIKLGEANFDDVTDPLVASPLYFVLLFAMVLLFVVGYAVMRRRIRDARNVALRRGKRANKVVVHRFNRAKQYMDASNERLFYDEVLHGMWGYMSDKLNIPVADLTKEYVREELSKRNADAELIRSLAEFITRCDEAHYSPMASAQMQDVYGCALHLVSQLELMFKRK